MKKTNETFKFGKMFKHLVATGKTSEEKRITKQCLIVSVAHIQDKDYKGKFQMLYDVNPNGSKKPRKEVVRPESNTPLQVN